jgi:hypothetical protein
LRYSYHIARYQASAIREAYRRALPIIVRRRVRSSAEIPVHVVSFSSVHDLPEQVASLRSFLRFVGRPLSVTVASDGSHQGRDCELLQRIDPVVSVVRYDAFARPDLPLPVLRYAEVHPMGKKLMVIASLQPLPTLYIDSDVLFFPAAGKSAAQEIFAAGRTKYLQQGWSVGYDLYLEQTLVHIAVRDAGGTALPSRGWALHGDDHFRYRDSESLRQTVLRHYVSMTRYKFWLAVSRTSMLLPSHE